MPSRRRLFLLVGLVLILVTGASIWHRTRPTPQLDRDHFDQIKDDMTLSEVEAILGTAPGDYGGYDPNDYYTQACRGWVCCLFIDRHNSPTQTLDEIQKKLEAGRIVVWTDPQYAIAVHLDGQNRVAGAGLGIHFREPNWWEQLLARLAIR